MCVNQNFVINKQSFKISFISELLRKLFEDTGFIVTSNDYISRQTVNKKEGLCVPRVFVQAKFTKPDCKDQQ